MRSIYVHPSGEFGEKCSALAARLGWEVHTSVREAYGVAPGTTLAIAPSLQRKLPKVEYEAPELGTLIFHPSMLPLERGPDAVRWAIADRAAHTGVTWFWCGEGYDDGPICEQEMVAIPSGSTAGRLYKDVLIPAGLRSLERALVSIAAGVVRRVEQDKAAATYRGKWSAP